MLDEENRFAPGKRELRSAEERPAILTEAYVPDATIVGVTNSPWVAAY